MEKLRATENWKEIWSTLIKVQRNQCKIQLWQTINGKRRIAYGKIEELNRPTKSVVIKPIRGKYFRFSRSEILYLRTEFENIVFKSPMMVYTNAKIAINLPNEIHLLEKRHNPRINFKDKDYKSLGIEKIVGHSDTRKQYSFGMIDLSHAGMAFCISSHDYDKFTFGDTIFIKQISVHELALEHRGQISYIVPIDTSTEDNEIGAHKYFRVGVKFDRDLQPEDYEFISNAP